MPVSAEGENVKKFKIALIGSHCSSKTTLACYLTQKLKSNGYPDTMLHEEIARRCPFPINEQGGFQANLWITLQTILDEAELKDKCTILVCDRSVFDQIVYSADAWTYGRMRQNEFVFIRRTVEEWVTIDPYDLVFLLQPQGLIADSVRPDNKEWQEKI